MSLKYDPQEAVPFWLGWSALRPLKQELLEERTVYPYRGTSLIRNTHPPRITIGL